MQCVQQFSKFLRQLHRWLLCVIHSAFFDLWQRIFMSVVFMTVRYFRVLNLPTDSCSVLSYAVMYDGKTLPFDAGFWRQSSPIC